MKNIKEKLQVGLILIGISLIGMFLVLVITSSIKTETNKTDTELDNCKVIVSRDELQTKCEDMGGKISINWFESIVTEEKGYSYSCEFIAKETIYDFEKK